VTTTPAEAQQLTRFDRVTSVLIELAIAVGAASLAALAFRDDARIPLACLVLGVAVGLFFGITSPFGLRVPPAPAGPAVVPGEPVPLGALAQLAIRELTQRPLVKAMQIAAVVCIVPPVGAFGLYVLLGERPSLFVLGGVAIFSFLAALACTAILPSFFLDDRTRSAFAVLQWAGARECERAFGGRHFPNFPSTAEDRRRWLDAVDHEAVRPVDVEIMVLAGEFEAARDAVAELPAVTPHDRFVKAEHEALVRYQATGDADLSDARRALDAIPPGRDRIEASVSFAYDEARRLLPGGDWRGPLASERDLIPEGDVRILVRDYGWGHFIASLPRHRRTFLLLAALTIALGLLQLYLV
jgi:hypothetical protein